MVGAPDHGKAEGLLAKIAVESCDAPAQYHVQVTEATVS